MTWRSFFPPASLLFLALWLILLAGGQSRFFQDPGTFWHIRTGQEILQKKNFPDTDHFTFTFNGKTWIPHQWLGECLMARIHGLHVPYDGKHHGFDSLLLFTAALLAALFTWLGVRLMRCGLHPSVAVVLVALAVAASSGHFHIRPHLATIVCFGVTMAFLCDFENKRIGISRLARLIPIFLIWSNIHGGMLGGLATFGLAILGWTVAWKIGWESPVSAYRQVGMLGLVLAGCAAMAFINPYGARLPEAWLDIYQMNSLPRLIKEHSPIDLADRNAWMILLFAGVYLLLLGGTLRGKPRVIWLLPIIWFGLACMRIRHAPLFAVGGLIAIADMFPKTRYAESLEASGSDLFATPETHLDPVSRRDRLAAFAMPAFAVVLAMVLQAARVPVPVIGHGWAKLDPAMWPTELLPELESYEGDDTHIFNEYAYGGFLIYHTPRYRVFVDDRCELFGDAWLSEFLDAAALAPGPYIEDAEKRYGPFNYALVYNLPAPSFNAYFKSSPAWRLISETETAAMYRKKESLP